MSNPKWMEDYVNDILVDVDDASYHRRAKAQLTDHLSEEYQVLVDRGYKPEEARAKAIEQMGGVESLRKDYKVACLHVVSSRRGYYFWHVLIGCLLMAITYVASLCCLAAAGYTYDARPGTPIIGNPKALLLFRCILFIVPFGVGALYFRKAFRYRPDRSVAITSALLFAWAGEKAAILGLSSLIYDVSIWRLPELIDRISGGGDQTAPWFTVKYILATMIGCIVLGLVSDFEKRRSECRR
ncbi:MAG: permease prefix domain 1-containing protein [Bacillota bacterium]